MEAIQGYVPLAAILKAIQQFLSHDHIHILCVCITDPLKNACLFLKFIQSSPLCTRLVLLLMVRGMFKRFSLWLIIKKNKFKPSVLLQTAFVGSDEKFKTHVSSAATDPLPHANCRHVHYCLVYFGSAQVSKLQALFNLIYKPVLDRIYPLGVRFSFLLLVIF